MRCSLSFGSLSILERNDKAIILRTDNQQMAHLVSSIIDGYHDLMENKSGEYPYILALHPYILALHPYILALHPYIFIVMLIRQ
uniref:Uncharacterized protein n=1 Tax=Timema monikensis TaxID=170555 RepID=A0A7R9HUN4_9NEOP|nr:unnamed protein product [Timema monikensis]